jgi:hypothetical protein
MRARTISVLTAGAIIAAAAVAVYAAPGNPPSARGSRGWTSDAGRPAQGQMQGDDDWGRPGGGRGGAWRRGGGPGGGGMGPCGMGPCGMGRGFGMRGRGVGMGGGFGMGRGYGGLAAGLLRGDGPLADRLKLTGTQKDKLHGIGEDLARKMIQHRADMETARLDLMDLLKNNSSDRSRIDSQIDTIAKLRADGMPGPRRLLVSAARWAVTASLAAALAVAPGAASAGKPKAPPDLSGQWRLDPSKSENPAPRGGRGGWGGRGGGGGGFPGGRGGWGGRRGGEGGEGGGGEEGGRERGGEGRGQADSTRAMMTRAIRLPDWLRIDETGDHVTFSDSTGVQLLEVVTSEAADSTATPSRALLLVDGTWKGDRLQVERTGPRGAKITSKYTLKDKGRTLEIETKIESNGPRPSMTFKRVYDKVTS